MSNDLKNYTAKQYPIIYNIVFVTPDPDKKISLGSIASTHEKSPLLDYSIFGRGGRNRTLLWSFGDSHSTDELHPFKMTCLLYRKNNISSINMDKKLLL